MKEIEKIKEILHALGFSNYKTETYLSLLKIGSGTIQQISKNTSVPSCKLYENLKWLHEQGYISLTLQKPLTYIINNPQILLQGELNKRKNKLDCFEAQLQKLSFDFPLPEADLIEITNSHEAFFRKIKESVASSKISISYLVKSWIIDNELWRLLKNKKKEGVKIRALGPLNKKTIHKTKWLNKAGIAIRNYIPKTTRFSVFDKKVIVIRLRKDEANYYSIWIKSEVLAEILENYFDLLWKNVKNQ